MKNLKIIDMERKGNVVRFYLGKKTREWGWINPSLRDTKGYELEPSDTYYGDDWDDAPYEHNAGTVYDEFIYRHKDLSFDFDDLVLEPYNGEWNSWYSKYDMVNRKVPCLIVIPKALRDKNPNLCYSENFRDWIGVPGVIKFYFGDPAENLER